MIITERKIDKHLLQDEDNVRQLVVTQQEYCALIKSSEEVRYKYTLKRIVDTETIWILSTKKDNIISLQDGGTAYIPIWSSKEYGQSFSSSIGKKCICTSVSLYDFLDHLKEDEHNMEFMIGVFPTKNDPIGKMVRIDRFIKNVDEEQEWY
ncbi:MAG: DUF2750 domain-containing protein [Muribaculaceae bacterium]|nr:DUF2750 domain-containing protein [Muribaculaceae bacterium]